MPALPSPPHGHLDAPEPRRWGLAPRAGALTALLLVACGPPAEPATPNAATGDAFDEGGRTAPAAAPATTRATPRRRAPSSGAIPRGTTAAQRALFAHTNAERRRHGRALFVMDAALNRVAQAHARDMARRRYFSHFSPDGQNPFQRLRRAGVRFGAAAENISENATPAAAVAGWMRSPGHRQNLLHAGYRRIGLGAVPVPGSPYGNHYYVQVFTD